MIKRFVPLLALVILSPACLKTVSKPDLSGKKASSGDEDPQEGRSGTPEDTGKEKDKVPPEVMGSPITRSIRAGENEAFKLGSKNLNDCDEIGTATAKGLGIYLNFEVLEDKTPISVSLERLCGELGKANEISLIRSGNNEIISSQPLPSSEVRNSTVILKPVTLNKGKYYVAIEVGGNTLPSLSSFILSSVSINAEKGIRFEGMSDF